MSGYGNGYYDLVTIEIAIGSVYPLNELRSPPRSLSPGRLERSGTYIIYA